MSPPPLPALFVVNGIGDQMLALPTVRALRRALGPTHVLLGPGLFQFLFADAGVARFTRVAWDGPEERRVEADAVARRAGRASEFVSLATWLNPTVFDLAHRMGARRVVGLQAPFPEVVPEDPAAHMFDRLFGLARHFDAALRFEDFTSSYPLSEAAMSAAGELLGPRRGDWRWLAVQAETRPDKMWDIHRFSTAIEAFLDGRPDYSVVVLSQHANPLRVRSDLEHRICWRPAHLEVALALVRLADLFFGVDTCFLHAADLDRKPSVGIFGPTAPTTWGFRLSPRFFELRGQDGSTESLRVEPVVEALLALAQGE